MNLQPLVAAEYLALADLLAPATDATWDTPSRCEGWRVREVIAHLTMPARYDHQAFMAELEARNFDFGRLSNELASRDARLGPEELLRNLRADELHRWTPPGGDSHGALNHVVVHGLDVTVPLGIERRPPDATMRVVLDDLTAGGVHEHFGTSVDGRRLEASDLDWGYGSGTSLRGPAADLVLVLCGRTVSPEGLEGPPLR
ncbi:MAG TPA: maleylpyruvate isomerase family mycothiol-dependent enzyme [Acidimicrobiales bacterium]|nr:maleylpyruvate isomerase family mycothiol-dependent enzyme [Acidimicrobiales bacterium]